MRNIHTCAQHLILVLRTYTQLHVYSVYVRRFLGVGLCQTYVEICMENIQHLLIYVHTYMQLHVCSLYVAS